VASARTTIFRTSIAGLTLLALGYLLILIIANSSRFQDWLKAEVTRRSGYEISAASMHLDPLLRLTLQEITASRNQKKLIQAGQIIVTPSPALLFAPTLHRLELRDPVVTLDTKELFDSNQRQASNLKIEQLEIQGGTLVLKLGDDNEVEFHSIAVDAENVDFGGEIGLRLQTEIPALRGRATIDLHGIGGEKKAAIHLEQDIGGGIAGLVKKRYRRTLRAEVKLAKTAAGANQFTADGNLDALQIAGDSISGELKATGVVATDLKTTDFEVTATSTHLPAGLLALPVTFPTGSTSLNAQGRYDFAGKKLDLKSLQLRSPWGEATGHGGIEITPAAHFDNAALRLQKIQVSNFKNLLPDFVAAVVQGGTAEADLTLNGLWRSPEIAGKARVFGGMLKSERYSLSEVSLDSPVQWNGAGFRAGDLRITGRKFSADSQNRLKISADAIEFSGSLEKQKDAAFKTGGTARLLGGAFASADGANVGEKLTFTARFTSTGSPAGDGISLKGQLEVAQGEILWGKFYGDLKTQRPTLEFDGDYQRSTDLLRLRRADLSLAGVGKLALSGEVAAITGDSKLRVDLKTSDLSSGGFFEFFIRDTLNRSYPALDRVAVAGTIQLSATAGGTPSRLTVDGALSLRGGDVRVQSDDWYVTGIDVALPFHLGYPAAASMAAAPQGANGRIAIASAKFGGQTIPPASFVVSLWDNGLRFLQPIDLPIYGGHLVISNLAWKDIVATPQAVSLSVEAKQLQLQKLTEALGWYRFGGSLSGAIDKIEWTGDSLRSQGQIDIAVFGGQVRVTQLEAENPFSPVPSIKLNARFQNIQLEQASKTFEFGKISGVLAGTIDDLVMSAGQPSSFKANIYSVEKSGVSQRISVESLNKITVLSSGNDAGALYGGIAGFFDSFRYSKLGFKAALKNDNLTLHGVESRGGQDYLVVGSLIPPTVNVVSHTQEIAFAELVSRLKRIQKSEKAQSGVQ
jgi:hypothetical protein